LFDPRDLSQRRIGEAFRDRAPRARRIGSGDRIMDEADQILSGIATNLTFYGFASKNSN